MKLKNKYATDLTDKDKNISRAAAKHIVENIDMEAWQCFVENSDNIFDFIKQNIGKSFADVVNENNYRNLFELFKIHSYDWDECFMQILSKFAENNEELTKKILDLLQNGSEDEKAYAAKYFSFIPSEQANYYLFNAYSSNYEPLKYNSAKALGDADDAYSYNYYINKLASEDDWDKIDAAQFLQWYGNKKAFPKLIETMKNSAMPEHIAGSVAMLDNISTYFNDADTNLRDLSLECYKHIIDSLAEIWPLATVIDFELYDCVENLITLLSQSEDKNLKSKVTALLLKTKYQFEVFYNNDEYKFNETKQTLEAMENILELLNEGGEQFWQNCEDTLDYELFQSDENRIIYALNIIENLELKNYCPLIKQLANNSSSQNIVYNALLNLDKFQECADLDKTKILQKIEDINLKAVLETVLK